MDANWKRTYDALTQLRGEVARNDPAAGVTHLSEPRRHALLVTIDAVRQDVVSVKRLGDILLSGAKSTPASDTAEEQGATAWPASHLRHQQLRDGAASSPSPSLPIPPHGWSLSYEGRNKRETYTRTDGLYRVEDRTGGLFHTQRPYSIKSKREATDAAWMRLPRSGFFATALAAMRAIDGRNPRRSDVADLGALTRP